MHIVEQEREISELRTKEETKNQIVCINKNQELYKIPIAVFFNCPPSQWKRKINLVTKNKTNYMPGSSKLGLLKS